MFVFLKIAPKLLIPFLLLTTLFGCKQDPIKIVKEGTLTFDNTVTVGNAFDNYRYFRNKSWTTFEGEQKRKVVEFEGVFDPLAAFTDDKEKSIASDWLKSLSASKDSQVNMDSFIIRVQFVLSTDMKNFSVQYAEIIIGKDKIFENISAVKDIISNKYPLALKQEIHSGFELYKRSKKKIEMSESDTSQKYILPQNPTAISRAEKQAMLDSEKELTGPESIYNIPAFSQVIKKMLPEKFNYLLELNASPEEIFLSSEYICARSFDKTRQRSTYWTFNTSTGDIHIAYTDELPNGMGFVSAFGTSDKVPKPLLIFMEESLFPFR